MKTSIRDLRASTKEIMGAVERGNTVIITNRGHECAKIVPIKHEKKSIEKKVEGNVFGIWKNNKKVKSVEKFIDEIRGTRQ